MPQPEGPTRPTTSPAATSRSSRSSTSSSPKRWREPGDLDRRAPLAETVRGSIDGSLGCRCHAPSARITAQVRRVSAGVDRGAISARLPASTPGVRRRSRQGSGASSGVRAIEHSGCSRRARIGPPRRRSGAQAIRRRPEARARRSGLRLAATSMVGAAFAVLHAHVARRDSAALPAGAGVLRLRLRLGERGRCRASPARFVRLPVAHFTCLAAARNAVMRDAGLERRGGWAPGCARSCA